MAVQLNSNPEILLRKRRNADRIRAEKQEIAKKRKALELSQKREKKKRFVRAESIVATTLATEREKERIKRISKLEHYKARSGFSAVESDFFLKITEKGSGDINDNDNIIREKIPYHGEERLVFVIRVKGPVGVNIPRKVFKVLTVLRLLKINTGVFFKLTSRSFALLKLVAPYIVVGTPSLSSIRSLMQKRARIFYQPPGDINKKEVILNDNNIIEEQLGANGIICVADIIHEIATLGERFTMCNFFLNPFKLNMEVHGFSAMSKLQKLKQREENSKTRPLSNSGAACVIQVDIDALIEKLN